MVAEGVQSLAKSDEVARHEFGALVNQLVEGVLAVGAGLAPEDRAGLIGGDGLAVEGNGFAAAFHGELLEVGGGAFEVLIVREDGNGLGAEEIVVPDGE